MFENYERAKTAKRRKWVSALFSISLAGHGVLVLALVIHGFWVIEKLSPPKRELALAIAPPPPPPPPPPKASKKKQQPKTDKKVVKKVKVTDTVQPVDKKDEPDVQVEIVDPDDGVEGGVEGGVAGGMLGGMIGGTIEGLPGGTMDKPPPPPPPPPKPQVVAPKAIDAQRVSGDKNILPDESTKMQLQRDGMSKISVVVKLCISAQGSVSSTNVVKSSGYPAYDRKITASMNQWRYAPFMINGKPSPVCSSVQFIYVQQ
jgi:protein TonB